MSPSELALPVERSSSFSGVRWLFDLLPGIALLLLVGYAGKVTEQSIAAYGRAHQLTLPNIEYVLWAIVFGLIVSNTVGVPKVFDAGIDTYEFWLKAGIVPRRRSRTRRPFSGRSSRSSSLDSSPSRHSPLLARSPARR